MAQDTEEAFDFERGLAELEALVARLENGDGSLEMALNEFERGIALTRACQAALEKAEQRVHILSENHQTKPFLAAENEVIDDR